MATYLVQQTLDGLGRDIVAGKLPEGHVVTAQQLATELGVSQPVVRESIRVLQSIGLVSSVKRVGVKVLASSSWNYFDPLVIKWRLDSEASFAQLRSLNELRTAVEPVAASLAATHAPDAITTQLLRLAGELRAEVRAGNQQRFIEVDMLFHTTILEASGNEMFRMLAGPMGLTVSARNNLGLLPELPDEASMQLHVDLADAIQGHRSSDARDTAWRLVCAINEELESTWRTTPRFYPTD
ncbi:FadR/GntR family transcriptional regulator [Brevibacterium zhoupengii]|uniref:FadR/GntR family transcriptional regulator n=1 Tax=Brevibacterium zhoupengii TaxID=2898795 RepID=UPI001E3982D1|nr:FCD domain-containing protein [Brevibacterium zhoupengii]